MSTCYNNCSIVLITNTGTTQSTIDFIDCSGSTIQFYINPSDSYYINYCGDFPISGENINIQVESESFDIFTFEDCCNKLNVFYTFLNSDIGSGLTVGDVIYFSNIIPSDGNNDIKLGCFKVAGIESDISLVTGYTQPYYSVLHIDTFYNSIFPCQNCLTTHPCPTECYSLYSCDGKFVDIKSSLSELSAYTNNFVSLDILTPEVSGNNICFFVTSIGVQSCLDTYDLKINEVPVCDCDCECYQFNTTISDLVTTYVDCNNDFYTVLFESNSLVKICSKIKPYFDSDFPIGYKLGGYCVNNNCPEVPIPIIQPLNECDVLTIYPLYVECITDLPTTKSSFDGSVSLTITGGTEPYTISWDNGSYSQSLTELTFGSYTATIVDYYGDFSATTTCVLSASTTTTTTTILPPTPTEYDNLCLFIDYTNPQTPDRYFDFTFNGYINEKPYWQSNSPYNFQILWDSDNSYWFVSGLTYGQIINLNPVSPPLTGWQALGFLPPFTINSIVGYSGSCNEVGFISVNVQKNDPTCGCDGDIFLIPIDGIPPYQFSINGGVFNQLNPVFTNLCPGLYPISVSDSSGNTFTTQVTLNSAPPLTIYTIELTLDTITQSFTINVTPTLPLGVTISCTLVHNQLLSRGPNQNTASYSNSLSVNVPPPLVNIVPYDITYNFQSSAPLPFPCEIYDRFITETYYKWQLTIDQNSNITGTYTNNIYFNLFSECNYASGDFGIYLDQVTINGCDCCDIVVVNPKNRVSSTGDIIFNN
jgi:hypothetical protein